MKAQGFADGVAIIAFVGEHQAGSSDRHVQQGFEGIVVGGLATFQDEAKSASLTVCAGVDLARKAAAASTKPLLMSPPFAPAFCEWPRTEVLSTICCQSSVRPSSTSVSSVAVDFH